MKLTKAKIENYRSIARLDFEILHGCQALIGINESGKSSILRALQLLDPNAEVKPTDLRIERTNEDQINSGSVAFHFELEADEVTELVNAVTHRFAALAVDLPLVSGPTGVQLNLKEFCKVRATGLYEVSLPTGKRTTKYWTISKLFSILPGWLKNPSDSTITVKAADASTDITIPSKGFIHAECIASESTKDFTPLGIEDISAAVGVTVTSIISKNIPKCIFWKYSEQYLLPSSIDVEAFCQDPNTCIPLRSIFELAGYSADELATKITEAKAHSQHRYIQILRKAASAATEHIRSVWKDHKTIRIDLQPNGNLLVPLVTEDQLPLDMASRSDGFKRFVSFLLQVSAKVRTNELNNVLLLIDEPEIALHPSGARSLMQELIDIGKSNFVVYSTHSIFMVDRTTVDRHLIVEKKDEVTTAKRAEKSKIVDEEVLYAAMGYSIFESLRERNVIFEGWRDKEIFRVMAEAMSKADKDLKLDLSKIGLTFAEGVKDVRHLARFLELASRGCLIISDSDNAATQRKREYEKCGSWGTWVTLQDILGDDITATTAEDLILRTAIIKRANKFRAKIEGLPALSAGDFGATETCLAALRRWLRSAGLEGEKLDAALDDLKTSIFDKIKREEISNDAEKIVRYIQQHDFS